jgi:hypothetical protein
LGGQSPAKYEVHSDNEDCGFETVIETAYSVFPSRFRDYSVNDRRIYVGVSASL